jgi:hypothetical protein
MTRTAIPALLRVVLAGALLVLPGPSRPVQAQGTLPHLRRQGDATQLVVDGAPMLVLGGELGNSRPCWRRSTGS